MSKLNKLFDSKLNVLNIGLEQFHETLKDQHVSSMNLDWKPIAGGNLQLINIIEELREDNLVELANAEALKRLDNSVPFWVDVIPAYEAINIDKHTILHAGPPIEWEEMCIPMQGAVIAALKYEGLALNESDAVELAKTKIHFEPCHHYNCVGPMTGVISYSMPLLCVENKSYGNVAYATLNEGAGDVARFGAYGNNTITRLKWMENVLAPVMKQVVKTEEINLKNLISQALNMGDELHMRNNSSTSIFIKTILHNLVKTNDDNLEEIAKFLITNNDQFFLNFAMAAMKVSADAAHGIEHSTMVTAMARNGVNIGIRVSGLKDKWFVAPAAEVNGLYFPGYSEEDANPDIGDSAIMETGGVGGFAMAAAPAIVKFLGAGSFNDALNYTKEMYEICLGTSNMYLIPNMDFKGTPLGIDILKVVESGIQPVINTAIASKKAGGGMVGAGLSRAPIKMFVDALKDYYYQREEN